MFAVNLASCLVTPRSSSDSSSAITEKSRVQTGTSRHTPTMTVVGSCCLLLFCYSCDCTLPTRNKKNVTLKEKMTPMDPGFDITVEGLQAAIFLGNFLAFS